MSWMIVVTGHPASGKTTLADRLGHDLDWPVWHRDDFKEILFDTLGSPTPDDSARFGRASWALLHHAATTLMQRGLPLIVEGNYSLSPGRAEVGTLMDTFGYQALELVVEAPPAVLATRFQRRVVQNTRHPGHHDAERLMEMTVRMMNPYEPLSISSYQKHVDTSQPDGSIYPPLLAWIKEHLEP